jgi:hypothetical protein
VESEAVVDNKKEVKKLVALSLGPRPKKETMYGNTGLKPKLRNNFSIFKLQKIR